MYRIVAQAYWPGESSIEVLIDEKGQYILQNSSGEKKPVPECVTTDIEAQAFLHQHILDNRADPHSGLYNMVSRRYVGDGNWSGFYVRDVNNTRDDHQFLVVHNRFDPMGIQFLQSTDPGSNLLRPVYQRTRDDLRWFYTNDPAEAFNSYGYPLASEDTK